MISTVQARTLDALVSDVVGPAAWPATTIPRVLFVDDDPRLLNALRRTLRHQPYECLFADDPRAALMQVKSNPVTVIVADEMMPGLNGTDLLARVHMANPETIGILLTGQFSTEVALRAINVARVTRVLVKPCGPRELIAAIRAALRSHSRGLGARASLGDIRLPSDLPDLFREGRTQLSSAWPPRQRRARALARRLHRHTDAVERLLHAFRRQ